MTSCNCVVEGDLFDSTRQVTVEAGTLDDFVESLVAKLQMGLPIESLVIEIYDDDFEEFVGK
jgi:hypothetical protein